MKRVTKYALAALAGVLLLPGCEEFEEFQTTVGAPNELIYTQTGDNNFYTVQVKHRPTGSTGEFSAKFPVRSNTTQHGEMKATLTYDSSLVEEYNTTHETTYEVLPEEFIQMENATLTLPEHAQSSIDSVTVTLTGDLAQLTARRYLAPLRVKSSSMNSSEELGTVYVAVETEVNIIRTIESVDDMVGFPATGRTQWSADCSNYTSLFDGNTYSAGTLPGGSPTTIDMKETQMVTGLCLGSWNTNIPISIEYSLDGENYSQAGTPVSGEYVSANSQTYVAFYDYVEARYLRLTPTSEISLAEVNIYKIESEEPTLYALCGTDNTLTGSIAHTPSGSFNGVNAAFDVYTTVFSASGYTVTASVDNSLIDAYNSANGTSYKSIDESLIKIANNPATIEANANKTTEQLKVSLEGDLSTLTDKSGYLIPVTFSANGAVTSSSRGVVYIIVTPVEELFRKNLAFEDIGDSLVEDRSGWTIEGESDLYTESYQHESLLDGDGNTYVRTWGGPVVFKIDFGKELDVTAVSLLPRQDNPWYASYHPYSIQIEYSEDGNIYTELGTAMQANGEIVSFNGAAFAALYGSQKMRYIRITASYNSNMGTAEFNVYSK